MAFLLCGLTTVTVSACKVNTASQKLSFAAKLSSEGASELCASSSPNPSDTYPTFPLLLSETCLFSDLSADRVSSGVRPYEPQYPLWSDGATKRRWIYLPRGSQIDAADMDGWNFPLGTRLFKEFTRDGTRVETRVWVKIQPARGFASWIPATYVWRADGTDADYTDVTPVISSDPQLSNVLGTAHDIPNLNQCFQCHKGSQDVALGFDALQLSKSWGDQRLSMDKLLAESLLKNLPSPSTPAILIHGSTKAIAAMGYLHVNCASCHSPTGTAYSSVPLNFRHNLDATSMETENAYLSAISPGTGLSGTWPKIVFGSPATSRIHIRMNTRVNGMPKIGSELVDTQGVAIMDAWINELGGL